jgi:zinc transport system ATP-binding protein
LHKITIPMPPIVSISALDFAYREQLVLKQIELDVPEGSTLGVIGPNGGGKTTLVRLLTGLLQPTRGSIRVDGTSPCDARKRGDVVGYLPQNPSVPARFPLSLRKLVQLGLAGKTGVLRRYAADDLRFVEQLIERMALKGLADTPIGELSGGQLQRALIARALAPRPKLLVLDEPTTGIDQLGQQQFIELMGALKNELNLTIVLVSHDLRAVSAMADRVACLNVTLHYHDTPQHLPAELMYQMFACDLEAAGLQKPVQIGVKANPVGVVNLMHSRT